MSRPCMAGQRKHVERSIDRYDEGKTAKKMEGQHQGITRRNWSCMEAGVQ